jgi:toxin YoeB
VHLAKIVLFSAARDDYTWWQENDRRVAKRVNVLIKDIVRNGHEGIGRPEPLRHDFSGYWSRRITEENPLVYALADGEVHIAGCRYPYGR